MGAKPCFAIAPTWAGQQKRVAREIPIDATNGDRPARHIFTNRIRSAPAVSALAKIADITVESGRKASQ
jgi:hypothetical protein